jgi:hypothetical protein
MQPALALCLIALSVAAGWLFAKFDIAFRRRAIVYASLWLVSVLVACMPYFIPDPGTWIQTYGSGAILGGIPSFLVHVVPAIIVYHATRLCRNRKKRSAVCR